MTSNKLYSQTFNIVDDENDNLKSLETSSLLINPTNGVSKSTYCSKPSFSVLEDSPSYNVRSNNSSISLITQPKLRLKLRIIIHTQCSLYESFCSISLPAEQMKKNMTLILKKHSWNKG